MSDSSLIIKPLPSLCALINSSPYDQTIFLQSNYIFPGYLCFTDKNRFISFAHSLPFSSFTFHITIFHMCPIQISFEAWLEAYFLISAFIGSLTPVLPTDKPIDTDFAIHHDFDI